MEQIKGKDFWERGDFKYLIKHLSKDDARLRHEIRYALFRVQNELEAETHNKAEKEHWAIAEDILKLKGATSVETFAKDWDISQVSPEITIVNRLWGVHEEHDQMMKRLAVPVESGDTPITLAKKEEAIKRKEARLEKKELNKAKKQNKQTKARKPKREK